MTTEATVLLTLAAGSYALKSAGPVLLGARRRLPAWVDRVATLLPAPLLAALVVTSALASGRDLVLDARMIGVVAAAFALRFRAPFVLVVVAAAAATAVARMLSGG